MSSSLKQMEMNVEEKNKWITVIWEKK